jgi:hypothetical protein
MLGDSGREAQMAWTKDAALRELNELVAEIPRLKRVRRYGVEHTRWLARTRTYLYEVFGPKAL